MKQFLYIRYKKISRWIQQQTLYLRVAADGLLMRLGWYKNMQANMENNYCCNEDDIAKLLANRKIEIKKEDYLLKNVVITACFTQKIDPLHNIQRTTGSAEYIEPWYNSIKKHGLNGIIIYDELPESFIKQYETASIQFRKYTAGNYSIFEERWLAGYLFLKETSVPFAFFTDVSDVTINKDPFILDLTKDILFVGRDIANRVWHSSWMLREIKCYQRDSGFYFPRSFLYMPLYNPGILGGNNRLLLRILGCMIEMIFKTKTETHKDMSLLNYVIYKQLHPPLKASLFESAFAETVNNTQPANIYSGYPLNSAFGKQEKNSKAFFSHK